MDFMGLIDSLFRQGLGELPVFYQRVRGMYLGKMVYSKGRIYFKDNGFLQDIDPPLEQPDWEEYLLGMVCYRKLLQWESLSFYGLDYCKLHKSVDPDHEKLLKEIRNSEGERLYDFVGSIYRACHMMLDNDLLPVVLLQPLESEGGSSSTGLAVADLRALLPEESGHPEIKRLIREAVEKQVTLKVEDITTDEVD